MLSSFVVRVYELSDVVGVMNARNHHPSKTRMSMDDTDRPSVHPEWNPLIRALEGSPRVAQGFNAMKRAVKTRVESKWG